MIEGLKGDTYEEKENYNSNGNFGLDNFLISNTYAFK